MFLTFITEATTTARTQYAIQRDYANSRVSHRSVLCTCFFSILQINLHVSVFSVGFIQLIMMNFQHILKQQNFICTSNKKLLAIMYFQVTHLRNLLQNVLDYLFLLIATTEVYKLCLENS